MQSKVAPVQWTVHPTTEQVAGEAWTLEALPSFEAAWDGLYAEIGDWGDAKSREDLSPMFGVIWGAARVLAHRVATVPGLAGQRVLELGCGLALPSMIAARRGAHVTATDQHRDVEVLLERNLAHNGLTGASIRFFPLDWRDPADLGTFDRVFASDVLYERAQPQRLAAMFDRTLGPRGVGWLADPGRPWLQEFAEAARALGFRVHEDVGDDGGTTEAFFLTLTRP